MFPLTKSTQTLVTCIKHRKIIEEEKEQYINQIFSNEGSEKCVSPMVLMAKM